MENVENEKNKQTNKPTYLNINVVAPSSENRTAGGEYRSFEPHSSALGELNESISALRGSKLLSIPNRNDPPSHCFPLKRPVSTSRYTCNSTRCPGAGRNRYLQTVGPCTVGDFICPNAQPDVFCKARESIVMLHTMFYLRLVWFCKHHT